MDLGSGQDTVPVGNSTTFLHVLQEESSLEAKLEVVTPTAGVAKGLCGSCTETPDTTL